jgi:predicted metal-dependent RNase
MFWRIKMKVDTVRFSLLGVVGTCVVVIAAFAFTRASAAQTDDEKQQVMMYLQSACEVARNPNKQVDYHNWKVQEVVDGSVTLGYIVTTDTIRCFTAVDATGQATDSKTEF